jgi:hypothetical protein
MQQNAGKSFDDALRSYNRQISVMEYEKSLIGETVTEQDRLNTARRVMAALVQNNDIYKTDEAREAAELLFRSAIGYDQLAEAAKRAAAEASRYAEATAAVRQRQDEEKKNQETVNGILEEARTTVDNYGKSERQLGVERLRANGALLAQITAYEDYMDQLEKLKKADEAAAIIEDFTDTLKEQYQMMLAGGIQNVFESIGEAWANDANAADAALQAAKQFAAEIIRQTSSLAIAAGLKLIIAGQFAPGIALLALGGVSGIIGGLFGARGGGSSGVDYDKYIMQPVIDAERKLAAERIKIIRQQLEDEKKLRKENIDKLEETFSREYEILKDLWDRNIISTEEFQRRGDELRNTINAKIGAEEDEIEKAEKAEEWIAEAPERLEEAKTDTLAVVAEKAKGLQGKTYKDYYDFYEYSKLSGYEQGQVFESLMKSQKSLDETLEKIESAESINEIIDALYDYNLLVEKYAGLKTNVGLDTAWLANWAAELTKDNRNPHIESELDTWGPPTPIIPTVRPKGAAAGADFITSGPQTMIVGDNPGGRERVQVTPIGSPNLYGPGGGEGIVININAPVYGVDDLYVKLQEAGKALARRGRI